MALPYLVKHIYNNGSEEVIRRGKKIYATSGVELIDFDDLVGNVVFRVKDDNYATYYKVHIQQFKNPKLLGLRCSCPYNLSEICRHKAAAIFTLQDMLDKNMLGNKNQVYDQRHTVVKMKLLDLKMIKMLCSSESFNNAEEFLRTQTPTIVAAKDEKVTAKFSMHGSEFTVVIHKNEERNFDTSCNCSGEENHPLCVHKTVVFLHLLQKKGANYFDSIRNWDAVKNKLLGIYGYSLSDDLTGKFEFTYNDGKPFLRVLDTTIKRVATPQAAEPKPQLAVIEKQALPEEVNEQPTENVLPNKAALKLGVVISAQSLQYPYLQIDAIQGETDDLNEKYVSKIEKLDLNKFINTEVFGEEDKALVQLLRKFLPSEVDKYLSRNSPFSGFWENIVHYPSEETLPPETLALIDEYLLPKFQRLFTELHDSKFCFFLPERKAFNSANLQPIECSNWQLSPEFEINYRNNLYTIECFVRLPHMQIPIAENECGSFLAFQYKGQFFSWQKPEDLQTIAPFLPTGKKQITPADWSNSLHNLILPLSNQYPISFGNLQKEELKDIVPEQTIWLKEKGEYLVFEIDFLYKGKSIQKSEREKLIVPAEEKLWVIHRNFEAEKTFVQYLENLHSNFIRTGENYVLALKGTDVLKNNWFFLFIDAMKDKNITVYGFEALKTFRFNTAKPSTKIFISSNTDWFDAKIQIQFGEQQVTVEDIKKALSNKQQYVPLQDGTLGILPEEWIKKYSLLFKIAEGKAADMKVSRFHFSVIEELYNERDEEELIFQLEEKYANLKSNFSIKEIEPPVAVKSILRPYQTSGFQWLNYLQEVQWGGILADDMGLGKTIQALSFLEHLKVARGELKALVVCPTTLMFNWQNEIEKFTPNLAFYTHHGGSRLKEQLQENKADVIITTYGTLRSDIKHFVEIMFDYVVLDESQAIKNPASKVTKAACLLKAKNRLCLSGTPLQNNTFDIYAQMNFLNPGMLGSLEYFKQEFSMPIDKFGEKEQKEHLRKILYPFILRRTKEQVAKDLPEKQEMVLFCEMGEEQRKIYDAFRNDFREKILGVVEVQGIQKSQLTILQGLMKLRQICDSPAIMNETERYPNVSVKLDEIGREITENISNHKALIFSQFLGMLGLIKHRLKELGVVFEYFDGSTSAAERERAINNFQNNDECRVFLISLKAGGVGLNLTAADYVYIVDPWWNPAVEQQAIDRTHRIGQTKNVFAYRMICTDTVEDKILKLQDRKRALARDLITDDEGFVKSLTREDVEYLFS